MKAILKSTNLSKSFNTPKKHKVLKDISFSIFPHETIAIMGPSGAGKSTLLHILGTLDTPSCGELEIAGKNAFDNSPIIRSKHVGFIFQNFNLLEDYTVLENIIMPSRISGTNLSKKEAKELLSLVNLADYLDKPTKHLSGGEKQRVAIARALCNNPDIILADEPSGNLDETNAKIVHERLLYLAKNLGKALIIVTHNQDLAKLCDKVFHLEDGVFT